VAFELTNGLEIFHKEKMIHRDIKLQRIFVTADGNLKLGMKLICYVVNLEEMAIVEECNSGLAKTIHSILNKVCFVYLIVLFIFFCNIYF
jgi:serine/threonine protein kinase